MKIYPIIVKSCGDCPNCRATIDSDLSIWGYFCSKTNKDIKNNRYEDTIHPKCPLKDLKPIKE